MSRRRWREEAERAVRNFERRTGIRFEDLGVVEEDPTQLTEIDGAVSLSGTVTSVLYRGGEDNFTIFLLELPGTKRQVKVAGVMPRPVYKGDEVTGTFIEEEHPTYGKQYAPLGPKAVTIKRGAKSRKTWESEMTRALLELAPSFTKSNAERLAKKLRDRDPATWELLLSPTAPGLAQIAGVSRRRLDAVSRELQASREKIAAFRELVEKHRFPPMLALAAVQLWPGRAREIAPKHPALLLLHPRASFDELVGSLGEQLSPEAIEQAAVLEVARQEYRQGGHTYPPNDRLVERAMKLVGKSKEKEERLRRRIDELVEQRLMVRVKNDTAHAGLYYVAERELAILKATVEESAVRLPSPPRRLVPPPGIDLTEEQRQAIRLINHHHYLVITGGAGTGKTHLIRAIAAAADHAGWSYVITATTGKAVSNLRQALNDSRVRTVHSYIGFEHLQNPPPPGEPLPHKPHLLVVDEAGMMDLTLAYELLTRQPFTRVVLVGDANQLPPVGPGQPFKDLAGLLPTVRLTQNFRQRGGGLILDAATLVLEGKDPSRLLGSSLRWHFLEDPEQILERVVELYQELDHPSESPMVIGPAYRGRAGIHALNRALKEAKNPGGGKAWKLGDDLLAHTGDPVVATENDWSIPLANGQVGRLGNGSNEGVFVHFEGQREVWVPAHKLEILRLGYALSVHRAQGSQARAVIFAVDPSHASWISRELIYTALTRAQEVLHFVGPRSALAGIGRLLGRRDTLMGVWRSLHSGAE